MSDEPVTATDLAQMLSEGLDLCVRARGLDDKVREAEIGGFLHKISGRDPSGYETRCATPALWVMEAYDTDLKAWEERARAMLLRSGLATRARPKP